MFKQSLVYILILASLIGCSNKKETNFIDTNYKIDVRKSDFIILDSTLNIVEIDSNLIILAIPEKACNPCYDDFYSNLKQKSFFEKIIVLSNYKIVRDYRKYFEQFNISEKVYVVESEGFNSFLKNEFSPHLFRVKELDSTYYRISMIEF